MGEAARRVFWKRHSPKERFDIGLRYQAQVIEEYLKRVPVPADATPEQRAYVQFQALRQAKRDADR